jgi:hypothetical protein
MNTTLKLLIVSLLLSLASFANAERKVRVTRVDKDLYKIDPGSYIRTKYCHEYVYDEKAILKYKDYMDDNKITFKSGNSCEVDGWAQPYKMDSSRKWEHGEVFE